MSTRSQSVSCRPACFDSLENRLLFAAGPVLWSHDTVGGGRLYTVDVSSGATTVIGSMGVNMYDIAFSPSGQLYGIDSRSNLYKISKTTAAVTGVGNFGTLANALVFSPTGKLLAAGNNTFFSIDPATAARTQIGDLDNNASAGDLAYDSAGNLYLTTTTNKLIKVSPTTGNTTTIGNIGFNEVFGLAFGPNGKMYGLSNATRQVFVINLSTGQGSSPVTMNNITGANGSTFVTEAQPVGPTSTDNSPDITECGDPTYTFTVTYTDPQKVKRGTLGTGDIRVTGPKSYSQVATFVGASSAVDATTITATYSIAVPGGIWDNGDNGTYTVSLQSNQVSDVPGTFSVGKTVGTFVVNVPPPGATLAGGTLTVNGTFGNNSISLSVISTNIQVNRDGVIQTFTKSAVQRINVRALDGNDTITIGNGIPGGTLSGSCGNDTIKPGTGTEQIYGGPDTDTVDYSSRTTGVFVFIDDLANDGASLEDDNVHTDVENLVGGSGNDYLIGSKYNNYLRGNGGNDTLIGMDGNDSLDGGSGADNLSGGLGNDTATYSSRTSGVNVTLDGVSNDGQANERDNVQPDIETIVGGSGNDTLTGNALANNLQGNGGNDTLIGGDGNDTLTGGSGADSLKGGNGNDKLLGKDGTKDVLDGGAGTDTVESDAIDSLVGIP